MPTNPNMVAIQTVTVGSGGASSIDFTSIPQTYTDLVLVTSLRSTDTSSNWGAAGIRFNGDSGSNYFAIEVYGTGSAAGSGGGSASTSMNAARPNSNGTTASTFSSASLYIPNYTSSNQKSTSEDSVTENNATAALSPLVAGRWTGTSAITSMVLTPSGGFSWMQHSTATLYGVTSAGYGAKATGGIISSDANYFYHTFLASGTFTPTQSITADCLVVAGGGGGGLDNGGGGGAGGLLAYTSQSLTATGYTITVGGGGASPSTGGQGANGSNSQFGSLTAPTGGGGGGGQSAGGANGRNGGSGGGTGNGTSTTAGTGTSGQGNNGGVGNSTAGSFPGGGGGGAGAAGGNAASATAGAGGAGSSSYSAWGLATGTGELVSGTYYYAGGGGAAGSPRGLGGAGGGGSGGVFSGTPLLGTSGLANTGGGGGGSAGLGSAASVSGGSGIVIVRYAK
jgi:hypothetical protein